MYLNLSMFRMWWISLASSGKCPKYGRPPICVMYRNVRYLRALKDQGRWPTCQIRAIGSPLFMRVQSTVCCRMQSERGLSWQTQRTVKWRRSYYTDKMYHWHVFRGAICGVHARARAYVGVEACLHEPFTIYVRHLYPPSPHASRPSCNRSL